MDIDAMFHKQQQNKTKNCQIVYMHIAPPGLPSAVSSELSWQTQTPHCVLIY